MFIACFTFCFSQKRSEPLKRKDCFFGVHFDFHATSSDTTIGKMLTSGLIDSFLDNVKPDFVQVDCKGHPGFASYPTKIGTPAGRFVKDPLKLWREETTKKHIGLYIHYSDLLDKAALQKHPDWGVEDADKKGSDEVVSIFSNYEDSLLIPQLKEVIRNYGIDGIWLDGSTWAVQPDYGASSLKAFKSQTGIAAIASDKNSANYKSFLSFERNSFLRYAGKYVNALHQYDKNIQIGINWLYSSWAPLPVTVNVDYFSGDLPSSHNDLYDVAFDARCYSSQAIRYDKAWDLMSWGFDGNGIRPVEALYQEAAEVIAMGGAWQCYFPQNRDASVKKDYTNTLQLISPFIRARQPFCQYAVPVKQVAVWYSGNNQLAKNTNIFQVDNVSNVHNVLNALLDKQLPAEIIIEHQVSSRIPAYPVIIIPELQIEKGRDEQVLNYVSNGGTVLLLGEVNISRFAKYAGVSLSHTSNADNIVTVQNGHNNYQFNAVPYTLQKGATELTAESIKKINGTLPIASVVNYGKGKIACLFINQMNPANNGLFDVYKEMIGALSKKLLAKPLVAIEDQSNLHVTVNTIKGKTFINLINTSRPINGKIPQLDSLIVNLRLPKPAKIVLQPGNKPLSFTYANGICTVKIQKISIHEILAVGK